MNRLFIQSVLRKVKYQHLSRQACTAESALLLSLDLLETRTHKESWHRTTCTEKCFVKIQKRIA